MPDDTEPSRQIVVDASLAIWSVLPFVSQMDVIEPLVRWRADGVRLVAPALWLAESTSAIRGIVHGGHIAIAEGRRALEDLFALEIELVPLSFERARSAFEWSRRLGQRCADDGFYLALAEELRGELWSADRRLVQSARSVGAVWAHWVGEETEQL